MATTHHLIAAASAPPRAAVVWLHGYGDPDPQSWADEFKAIRAALPHTKWVHLRAPKRPQAYLGGLALPSWGDWEEDGCTHVGSRDYNNENIANHAMRSSLQIIISALIEEDRIASSQIVVGGFSMGATGVCARCQRFTRSPVQLKTAPRYSLSTHRYSPHLPSRCRGRAHLHADSHLVAAGWTRYAQRVASARRAPLNPRWGRHGLTRAPQPRLGRRAGWVRLRRGGGEAAARGRCRAHCQGPAGCRSRAFRLRSW